MVYPQTQGAFMNSTFLRALLCAMVLCVCATAAFTWTPTKEIEFVVIREYRDTIGYRKNIPYLNDNYKEIKKFKQLYEGMDFTYYLYCLK